MSKNHIVSVFLDHPSISGCLFVSEMSVIVLLPNEFRSNSWELTWAYFCFHEICCLKDLGSRVWRIHLTLIVKNHILKFLMHGRMSKCIDLNRPAGHAFHPKVLNILSELNIFKGCFRNYVSPLVEFESLKFVFINHFQVCSSLKHWKKSHWKLNKS